MQRVVECLRNINRFLSERAVGHEENFIRLHARAQFFHFLDEVRVNLEAPRRVENDTIGVGGSGGCESRGSDRRDVLRNTIGIETQLFLLREDLQLIDGGRTVDVAPDDKRPIAALFQQLAQFGGRSGFTGAVQTDHQDFQRTNFRKRVVAFAEQADEFVVDDFDDLLAGSDSLGDFLSDALLLNAFDEFAGDLEVNVRGKQRGAHFLERLRHVFFGKCADAAKITESLT